MFGKPKDENDHLQRPAAVQSGEQVLTENDHFNAPPRSNRRDGCQPIRLPLSVAA